MILDKYKKTKGFGKEIPPNCDHVLIYFLQKGMTTNAARKFLNYHTHTAWKNKHGTPIKCWKTEASEWIWQKLHGK